MIFNQFGFLFIFLPLVVAAFYMAGATGLRVFVLAAASILFYGLSGVEHAAILLVGIFWVYLIARSPRIVGNKGWLLLAIALPVSALFYYKYLGFFIRDVLALDGFEDPKAFDLFSNIILPAGISFFTFQLVSFAIDRYRGEIEAVPPLRKFVLYISFFPQLVAGPILRFRDVATPLARLDDFRLGQHDASRAIAYICLGLATKIIVADSLSHYLEPFTTAPDKLSVIASIYVILAYSFQIYFDFYGYSMIAIGLGILFGFSFPQNFARPYESINPREFWRRWHITLSYWIRDYLYLPLGGREAYLRNTLIVFALCGLWHGAGWTFITWGLYHAFLVLGYHFTAPLWDRAPGLVQRLTTFSLVSLGWVLFLFDFKDAAAFGLSLTGGAPDVLTDPSLEMWAAVAIAAAVCFGLNFEKMAEKTSELLGSSLTRTASYAVLFVTTLFFMDRTQSFIYFRF